MTIRFESESLAALEAVASAEELLVASYDKSVVSIKGARRDIVTSVDLLLERHISSILSRTGLPILGEEAYSSRPQMPQGDGYYWLVDPIDGTVNFANGLPYFAISVGLWDGQCFPVGAVSMPAFKELYFTQGEEGAFLNGQRLNVEPAVIDQALIGAGLPSRTEDRRQYDTFGRVNEATRGCLRLGSAASLVCLVACGRLQGAYGIAVKMWDVAGALAVARRAGADVFIRCSAGEPLIDFVAAAPGVGGPLRELVGNALSGGWQ